MPEQVSKREMNEWASRAIMHLEYVIADLKRFKKESRDRAIDPYFDASKQQTEASKMMWRIFKGYYPDPDPVPAVKQPAVKEHYDKHVQIRPLRRDRMLGSSAPVIEAARREIEADDQLLLPGVSHAL